MEHEGSLPVHKSPQVDSILRQMNPVYPSLSFTDTSFHALHCFQMLVDI
jgi:hypothetical protein